MNIKDISQSQNRALFGRYLDKLEFSKTKEKL